MILACVKCERVFNDEVKFHCREMCQSCYASNWYAIRKKSIPKEEKNVARNCVECNLEFNVDIDIRGKIARRSSKGCCVSCYNKKRDTICPKCGADKLKRSQGICSNCRIDKKTKSLKEGKTPPLPKEYVNDVRSVLLRYKWGFQTQVDPLIVTDLYINIYDSGYKNALGLGIDQYEETTQVISMLRLLKICYDNR